MLRSYNELYGVYDNVARELIVKNEEGEILFKSGRGLGNILTFITVSNRYVYILSNIQARKIDIHIVDLSIKDGKPTLYSTIEGVKLMPCFISKDKIVCPKTNGEVIVYDIPSKSEKMIFSFDRFTNVQKGDSHMVYDGKKNFYFLEEGGFGTAEHSMLATTNDDGSIIAFTTGSSKGMAAIFIVNQRNPRDSWNLLVTGATHTTPERDILIKDDNLYVVQPTFIAAFNLLTRRFLFRIDAEGKVENEVEEDEEEEEEDEEEEEEEEEEERGERGERGKEEEQSKFISGIFKATNGGLYMRQLWIDDTDDHLYRIDEKTGRVVSVPDERIFARDAFDIAVSEVLQHRYNKSLRITNRDGFSGIISFSRS